VLLALFVVVEARVTSPLLPLRVVSDRDRGGSFLGSTLVGIALLGTFLSLTYYLQATLHYSALKTGLAFLPLSIGIIISATIASQLLPRVGPKLLVMFGTALGTVGLFLFTKIGVDGDFIGRILPAEVILSLGMGFAFVPNSSTALIGVDEHDAGVASALVNTTQQIGGSLGTALLNTVAASATATFLVAHGTKELRGALVHGYTTAFEVSGAVLLAAFVVAATLIRRGVPPVPEHEPEGVTEAIVDFAELGA